MLVGDTRGAGALGRASELGVVRIGLGNRCSGRNKGRDMRRWSSRSVGAMDRRRGRQELDKITARHTRVKRVG